MAGFSALLSLFKIFNILKGGNVPGQQKTYSEESIFQGNVIVNENHLTGGNSVTLGQTIKTGNLFLIKNPLDLFPIIPSLFASGGIIAGFSTFLHTGFSLSVGLMQFIGRADFWGSANVNGQPICAPCPSDERLKTNVQTLHKPLDKILALRGVSFNWNEDIWASRAKEDPQEIGLIAQEVEKILPEVVREYKITPNQDKPDENMSIKGVKYENIIALLIEGIKEQQEQINELKATVEELKNGVG